MLGDYTVFDMHVAGRNVSISNARRWFVRGKRNLITIRNITADIERASVTVVAVSF